MNPKKIKNSFKDEKKKSKSIRDGRILYVISSNFSKLFFNNNLITG